MVVGDVDVGPHDDVANALGNFLQRADGLGEACGFGWLRVLLPEQTKDLEDVGGDDVGPPLEFALPLPGYLEGRAVERKEPRKGRVEDLANLAKEDARCVRRWCGRRLLRR